MRESTTILVERCLADLRAGKSDAVERLFEGSMRRLTVLSRQMFNGFPSLQQKVEADDILQDSIPRLLRAINDEKVAERATTAKEFLGLAACQMRRVLLDLCRKYSDKPAAVGYAGDGSTANVGNPDPQDPWNSTVSNMEIWSRFHEAVEQLPDQQKSAFEFIYYHELSYAEAAQLFPETPSEKTVRRWFRAAIERIEELVGEELPLQ